MKNQLSLYLGCLLLACKPTVQRPDLSRRTPAEQGAEAPTVTPTKSPSHVPESSEQTLSTPQVKAKVLRFGPQTCKKNPATQACYTIDASLMELSGIAASEKNEGIYWAQNDEGVPIVYGLNEMGQIVARLQLTGASNLDWEDLSLGPGPKPQVPYLYVGDIGDKGKAAGQVTVYRMEEPQLTPGTLGQSVEAPSLLALSLRYPGNAVLDFETLMIDPREGDLYLIQKGGMKVFRARKDALQAATAGTVISLEEVRNTGGWGLEPSSGNFSPSGDEIVLRDEKTAWLFQRQAGQSVADALGKVGLTLTLGPEFNGEAICFDRKGLDLVTLSENTSKDADAPSPPQPISFYPRLAP